MMQNMARRWASARFAPIEAELEAQSDPVLPGTVYRELNEQGWLPGSSEELAFWSVPTLARLGQALGGAASSAFLPVLTHVVAAKLIEGVLCRVAPGATRVLATSPYWDCSKVSSPVSAKEVHGRVVLDGDLPRVVNADSASHIVVPARNPAGEPLVCLTVPSAAGLTLSDPLRMLGLRGITTRMVHFDSTPIDEECILRGEQARLCMAHAADSLAWGVLGLLCGIITQACGAATEYAQARHQGGRPIIEHPAVALLVDRVKGAKSRFELWLRNLHSKAAGSGPPMSEARRLALEATDASLQVHGGLGYMSPGVAEKCWRDARQVVALAWSKPFAPSSPLTPA